MAAAAFSALKKFYGSMTIDVQTSADASIIGWTGIKADVPSLTIEKKTETDEFEDGSEVEVNNGWTGTLEISLGQLDATDLATLEDNAPGMGTDADHILFIFTDRGDGIDDYTIEVGGLSGLIPSIESGKHWTTKLVYKISGTSAQMLHDLVTIVHPES